MRKQTGIALIILGSVVVILAFAYLTKSEAGVLSFGDRRFTVDSKTGNMQPYKPPNEAAGILSIMGGIGAVIAGIILVATNPAKKD